MKSEREKLQKKQEERERENLHSFLVETFLGGDWEIPNEVWQRSVCKRGHVVEDHPDGKESIVFIVSGKVDVYHFATDGHEVLLSELTRGDCIGWINMFSDTELTAVFRCRETTELLSVEKNVILDAMRKDPERALKFALLCNQKVRFLLGRIECLTTYSGKKRLIQYLLDERSRSGDSFALKVSREELASSLGISRASLFRELTRLQEQELIEKRGKNIEILNQIGLEEILYI